MRASRATHPLVTLASALGGLLALVSPVAAGAAAGSTCHPGPHLVCVDRESSGRTVQVKLGQRVTLELGGGLRWGGLREVGRHLLRPHGASEVRRGVLTATYVARGVGRTSLRATGAPTCVRGQACPQFIVLWQVQVVVAGPT